MTNDDRAHSAPINDDAAEGGREGEEKAGKRGGGKCRGGTLGPQAPPTPPKSPGSVTPIEAEGPWGRKEKAEADSLAATALLIEKLDPKQLGPAIWPVVLDAWRRVQGYIQTVEECRKEDRTRIQTLETRVKEVEKGLSGRTLKGSSWAHIAGNQQQGVGPVPNATAAKGLRTAAPAKKLDNAKMRRVTVQIRDEKEKEAAGKADKEDLVRSFRNAANEATKDIVAAFTKPAGEVVLITATVEAREALEKRREWATVGYPSAEVKRQTFPVVVHGVRRAAIDIEKQEATITKIVEANQVLHPDLQIERVWWPAGASRLGPQGREKTASSLVLELVTPEEVNEVVRKGLVGADGNGSQRSYSASDAPAMGTTPVAARTQLGAGRALEYTIQESTASRTGQRNAQFAEGNTRRGPLTARKGGPRSRGGGRDLGKSLSSTIPQAFGPPRGRISRKMQKALQR
ncbi:MAG: hypothetical protein Q9212_007437 [Teloschistes hypoglaucus]